MKIRGSVVDDGSNSGHEVQFKLEGRAVAIATNYEHVIMEIQDLTQTIYIHVDRKELERVLNFCKTMDQLRNVECGCKNDLPNEFISEKTPGAEL